MFALIGCLIGCGSSQLTYDEALGVYEAFSSVNADVYAVLDASSAPDREPPLAGDTTGPPPVGFQGTVVGPGSWGGAVHVASTTYVVATEGKSWSVLWSLEVDYAEVTYGDLELDARFWWDIETTAGTRDFDHNSRVIGDFVARGAPQGAGELEFQTQVTRAGVCEVVSTRATVGGHQLFPETSADDTDGATQICL